MPNGSAKRKAIFTQALQETLGDSLTAGADLYTRNCNLARMLGMSEEAVDKAEVAQPGFVVERLRKALAAETRRHEQGHYTADRNRWIALQQALRAEERILSQQKREAA